MLFDIPDAIFTFVLPALAGIYGSLMIIYAIFHPPFLPKRIFELVLVFPGGKVNLGRLVTLIFGILFFAGGVYSVVAYLAGRPQ